MRNPSALLLGFCLATSLGAQTPKAAPASDAAAQKRADIRKLLTLQGAGENGVKAMQATLESQKQANPQIPEVFWTTFMQEFNAERIIETALPVYEKHLTEAELKALLAFYATPEGRSFATKQGVIMAEALLAGQEAGKQIGMEVALRLQKEGKM